MFIIKQSRSTADARATTWDVGRVNIAPLAMQHFIWGQERTAADRHVSSEADVEGCVWRGQQADIDAPGIEDAKDKPKDHSRDNEARSDECIRQQHVVFVQCIPPAMTEPAVCTRGAREEERTVENVLKDE